MFHALKTGRVDAEGLTFRHDRMDTAALNQTAVAGGADVVAVSLGVLPHIADRYLVLPHGASVGRGYGPVVVARQPMKLADLQGRRVGIPGNTTTAWLILQLMQSGLIPVVVPIAPFSRIFDALDRGEIDAALLIHEGRLLYEQRGYHRVAELGEWWQAETGLPLPLGVNVIRKGLGDDAVRQVSRILRRGIEWALQHKADLVTILAAEDRGDAALAEEALVDRYLGMYANQDTAFMAPDVRTAIDLLFVRARNASLIQVGVDVGWAP